MNLSEDLPSEDQIRVRLFCISSLCFTVAASINFIGLTWALGLFAPQHMVSFFIACSGLMFMLLLKRFKDPIALTWVFAIMSTMGGWLSAYIDYSAATETTGIGLAYSPYMVAILVIVCLLGTRRAAIFYAGLCIATLIGFYLATVALGFAPAVLEQNRMSVVIRSSAILLTLGIMVPVSQMIYSTLQNLEYAVERAKRAENARKQLLATMSHEVRTPLNGIISVSDLLDKRQHDETTRSYLDIIGISASNLLTIVNESLGRARSEHLGDENGNAIQINSQPFDPRDLIQQVCNLFTANASQKGLWVGTYGLEALPVSLLGDAPHLRQVLNNLVGNAVKFTHQGGVRIGARLIDAHGPDYAVQFFVQDTGVGIEDDAKARVFERFGQSASALTTKADGTGLGLAICNDLVTAMGGTLEMDSNVGVGTAFYFTLVLPDAGRQATTFAA